MEHAFLDTIPDIPSHRFGEKGRKARRIRGEVMAMRLTDRYIHDHLPGLLANPPMPVSSAELLKCSKVLFDHLAEHTSCYRELAAGYNRFCRFITSGNEAGAWSYPAIAKAHELPTQPLLRDAEWQRYSILVHKIDQELQRKIAGTIASQLDDAEMLIGLLVFYAATLSTVQAPQALKALVLAALDGPEIYIPEDSHDIWILLRIPDASVTNVYEGDESVRLERHLLDPVTLSLIHRLSSLQPAIDRKDIDPNRLVGLMNRAIERLGVDLPKFSSPQQFSEVALSIEEQFTSIPHALICAQAGLTPTVSLPERYWRELLWLEAPAADDSGSVQQRAEPVSSEAPQAKDLWSRSRTVGDVCSALTKAIREPKHKVKAEKERLIVLGRLAKIDTDEWPLAGKLLWSYYQYHLGTKGNEASSVRTYHGEIGRRLLVAMEGKDAFDPDDLDEVYRKVIDSQPSDTQQIRAAHRLTELHGVGRSLYGLPALYEPLMLGLSSKRHVRAAFVSEGTFQRLLIGLQSLEGRSADEIERLTVFSIILYRTGLRPDDAVRLQLKDIEFAKRLTLKIRNNSLGSGKTENARRTNPLGLLMTRDEDQIVRGFLNKRRRRNRNRPTAAIFNAIGSETQPMPRARLSNDIVQVLREIGHPGVPYDFRHTAISRMFLIGERDWTLLEQVTPYSRERLEAICEAVFGHAYEWHERYRALAAFAGHGSPSTTFDYYVHFSSWVVYRALRASTRTFDVRFLAGITGLGETRLRKAASVVGEKDAAVRLEDIRDVVIRACRSIVTRIPRRPEPDALPSIIESRKPPSPSLWDVHSALEDWQNGYSIESILFEYGFEKEQFDRHLAVAQSLAAIRTRKGRPRLVSSDRKARQRPLIAPVIPSGAVLRHDADALVSRFKAVYRAAGEPGHQGPSRADLAWATTCWLLNTNAHEPYAHFSDRKTLRRFLKITACAIPSDRWRIVVPVISNRHKQRALEAWDLPKRYLVVAEVTKAAPARPVAYLHLRHPADKELVAHMQEKFDLSNVDAKRFIVKKYTAHTLRFVFHMMAIIMFTPETLERYIGEGSSGPAETKRAIGSS